MSNPQNPPRPMSSTHSRKRSSSAAAHDHTPTTPRLSARFSDQPAQEIPPSDPNLSTPTRRDFGGIPGQRPLPEEPFTPSRISDKSPMSRENSRRSVHSHQSSDSQDVEMGDDDEEGRDRLDDSDDSASSDKPSRKKKKGQRFYCTDFPPCQLSFTRSEHLARHIRKHTGERPFECHCSRRFSRLDNLRQHAQTVHVNEEIPGDSLAATGTRFQRQIRTDRVRPPNVRPRASTASSQGGHSRGHSRNLSASSITSTTSSIGLPEDSVPRPAPLAMAQDPAARARLSLDTFNPAINGVGQYGYYPQSPSGFSSPTSATFSTGASSPRFPPGVQSPSLPISRSSFYNGSRTPARRLSVPSGVNPFPASNQTYPPVYFAPLPSSTTQYPNNTTSLVPTSNPSGFSHHRRAESDAELEWRRRTWHPGTHSTYSSRPATSGLTYHQTPDDAVPALAPQPAASQITRLPGIESFDHAPPPPNVPTRNVTSPMQAEQGGRPLTYPSQAEGLTSGPVDRRISSGWEAGLHYNLNKLDIAKGGPPTENQGWAEQARARRNERPTTAPHTGFPQQPAFVFPASRLQPAAEIRTTADQGMGERSNKRQAWYGGPVAPPHGSQPIMIAHRTSPESSSSDGVPTPSTSQGRELHPAIMHANGLVDPMLTEEQQRAMQAHYQGKPEPTRADSGFHSYVHVPGQSPAVYMMQTGIDPQQQQQEWRQQNAQRLGDMGRLEALVAVATSENRAVEHHS